MENSLDKIRSLIMQEIDGDISDEDRRYLLQLASEDSQVFSLREYLWETVGNSTVNDYLQSNPVSDQSQKLLRRIRNSRMRTIIYLGSSVAAAAILAFIAVKFLNTENRHPSDIAVQDFAVNQSKNIELSLSSGDKYVLNGDSPTTPLPSVAWKVGSRRLSYNGNGATSFHNTFATLKVPAGKEYSLILTDGTEIQVNSASIVRFPLNFGDKSRDIFISGEAYIKASADPSRPLKVHLASSVVEVLGTEFNVNAYDSILRVALIKGKVKVSTDDKNVLLSPGQMCKASATGLDVDRFDEYETLSWRTGQFIFRNARFEDVCKVIPRWFGVSIVMDNQKSSSKRFSGIIDRNQPLDIQLQGLQATGALNYRVASDSTIHFVFK